MFNPINSHIGKKFYHVSSSVPCLVISASQCLGMRQMACCFQLQESCYWRNTNKEDEHEYESIAAYYEWQKENASKTNILFIRDQWDHSSAGCNCVHRIIHRTYLATSISFHLPELSSALQNTTPNKTCKYSQMSIMFYIRTIINTVKLS
jgi:hypothetical protein